MENNNTDKNNAPIEAYDGKDAYYEGTDKDYEDFLKQVDGSVTSADTADVESTDGDSAGETINIKGVIDMVRKKAGESWNTAKKISGEVKEQINDYIAAANEKSEKADEPLETEEKAEPSAISTSISNTAKAAKSHIKSASEATREKLSGVSSIGANIDKISSDMESAITKLDTVNSKLSEIEVKQIENRNNYDRSVNDIRVSMNSLVSDISEINQSAGSIAKLSDAVFDLKNTQANTKKAIADVEERIIALRRKVTAGVTIISVLSVIMIVLEIINLLS